MVFVLVIQISNFLVQILNLILQLWGRGLLLSYSSISLLDICFFMITNFSQTSDSMIVLLYFLLHIIYSELEVSVLVVLRVLNIFLTWDFLVLLVRELGSLSHFMLKYVNFFLFSMVSAFKHVKIYSQVVELLGSVRNFWIYRSYSF